MGAAGSVKEAKPYKSASRFQFAASSVQGLEARVFAITFTVHGARYRLGSIRLGTAPCVSTICIPDVTAHDQTSQAFPICICILLEVKRARGLG